MKFVLMLAEEFPPINIMGTWRPLGFAKYLAEFGFWPVVITRRDYQKYDVDYEPLKALTGRCDIHRVPLLDSSLLARRRRRRKAQEQTSERNAYGRADRRIGPWRLLRRKVGHQLGFFWPAVAKGLEVFVRQGFDLIWATGFPWQAVKAGYLLSRITVKPYVVDLRDPWTYGTLWHPTDREAAEHAKGWERRVLTTASRTVYTSPLTAQNMRRRLRPDCQDRIVCITNGFDECQSSAPSDKGDNRLVFRYVGKLAGYRDPDILFKGLRLACQHEDLARDLRVEFVGRTAGYEQRIVSGSLSRCVDYMGYVSKQESNAFMRGADVLVLLQTITGPGRDVISGKAYEYLAARRPILGIVPEDGGDAWLLRETSAGIITGVTDPERIAEGIRRCWRLWKEGRLEELAPKGDISRFSRRNLTRQLAALFDEVLAEAKRRL